MRLHSITFSSPDLDVLATLQEMVLIKKQLLNTTFYTEGFSVSALSCHSTFQVGMFEIRKPLGVTQKQQSLSPE